MREGKLKSMGGKSSFLSQKHHNVPYVFLGTFCCNLSNLICRFCIEGRNCFLFIFGIFCVGGQTCSGNMILPTCIHI